MPCLGARGLSLRCSSAASSASISERTEAMAVCAGRRCWSFILSDGRSDLVPNGPLEP